MGLGGSVTWDLDADGTWTNAANWNPNTVPNGVTDVAFFGTNITANRTISINNSNTMTIAEAVFGAAYRYTITSTDATGVVRFSSTGLVSRVTVEAGTTVPSFKRPTDVPEIDLGNPLIVSNANNGGSEFWFGKAGSQNIHNNGHTITFDGSGNMRTGAITGPGELVKNGTGTLTFDGFDNSDYTGPSTVNRGRVFLWFGHFGDSVTVTVNDGGSVGMKGDWNVTHNFVVSGRGHDGGGVFRREECQGNVQTRMTGAITLASNSAFWVQCMSTPLIITNVISGPGGLENVGPGLLILTNGANTYAGTTTVSSGAIHLGGSLAHCNMSIASNATFDGSGVLRYNLDGNMADRITAHGTLSISNLVLNLNIAGVQTLTEHVVADYSQGTLVGNAFKSVNLPKRWEIRYMGTPKNPGSIVLLAPPTGTVLAIF